jgi:hypothetical protein
MWLGLRSFIEPFYSLSMYLQKQIKRFKNLGKEPIAVKVLKLT